MVDFSNTTEQILVLQGAWMAVDFPKAMVTFLLIFYNNKWEEKVVGSNCNMCNLNKWRKRCGANLNRKYMLKILENIFQAFLKVMEPFFICSSFLSNNFCTVIKCRTQILN